MKVTNLSSEPLEQLHSRVPQDLKTLGVSPIQF